MTHKQLLLDVYRAQPGMLAMHVADFSEADLLVRPVEGANHAAWQLGHLSVSTVQLVNAATPGALPQPSPQDAERFGGKGAKLNDGFEPKEQLLKRFEQVNDACIKWLDGQSDAELAKPTPESLKAFAPTVGSLAHMLPGHLMLHVGQIQVIRRKLGKPHLF